MMEKTEVLIKLQGFNDCLHDDVISAFENRGYSFGRERFSAWQTQFSKFLDENLPGTSSKLNTKLHKICGYRKYNESDLDVFIREDGEPCLAFIDSLKLD